MPFNPLLPEQCRTMADVRAAIDALDAEVIELLARRFGYMRAAARIKPARDQVRDDARKAQVIAHVRSLAEQQGIPPVLIEDIWERLVEGSIAYEFEQWDRERGS